MRIIRARPRNLRAFAYAFCPTVHRESSKSPKFAVSLNQHNCRKVEPLLPEEAYKNAACLKCAGAHILHGVDATRLEKYFRRCSFDTIIFQFPNVGSRKAKYGQNPNHIMIRKFLRSAKPLLAQPGKILISTIDSPHYEGVFKFDRAAEFAGFAKPETYPFDPGIFRGYSHINTNDDEESALNDHDRFITWMFKVKE